MSPIVSFKGLVGNANGIKINGDTISIDQSIVALKTELNQFIKDNDTSYSAVFRGKGVWVKAEGAYTSTSYADGSIGRSIPNQPGYTYDLPNKSGTFAMTSDIITSYDDLTDKPTIPTKTSDLQNDSGFITGVTWNDVTGKPTFATVATTGDYDDLLNKPTIPTVPSVLSAFTNDVGYITGITSSDVVTALGYTPGTSNFSGDYDDLTDKPTIPDSTSDLINDSGFITGITSSMIISALGYTPGTSSFSGSYNDLTDKPTIPTKTSDLQNDSGFITNNRIELTAESATLEPNINYNFGESETLTLEFGDGNTDKVNEYSFTFISGATPTVLTLPDTVKWANELTIEANKRYEISIVDNIGLWCAVEVDV